MLQGGELEQLSFMLAADPEGAKDFLEKIRQEGRQDEKDRVARLFAMAARGELATVDVETQVLNLLNQGMGQPMVGPIGTVPARRPRELEASGDRPFNPEWASDEPPRRRPRRPAPSRGEPDRRGTARRGPDRGEPYPGDDPEYDDPGSRPRRRGHRPEPYPADDRAAQDDRDHDGHDDDRRGPVRRRPHRPEPYSPRDDADYDEPRAPARQRTYRPEPYSPGPDRDHDPEYDDDAYDYDEPRSRDRRPAHRAEPYYADDADDADDAEYRAPRDEARRRSRRPELGPAGPVPDHDPEDESRSGDQPRTYRPEPYHPYDEREWERPRRRRRAADDGWSWAEEDR
ncbi:hypothetical protein [Streptomyces sp. HD]|uniref:hypothetical protein n=1 Tax=Streptomyces sp. HD TaxID=3020892 RepID=UPI00232F5958|nr:hypothetical protein [Streptomyces sp. HD]MDC0772389.1 hypothetical protein [Streptomyces sp. HD]